MRALLLEEELSADARRLTQIKTVFLSVFNLRASVFFCEKTVLAFLKAPYVVCEYSSGKLPNFYFGAAADSGIGDFKGLLSDVIGKVILAAVVAHISGHLFQDHRGLAALEHDIGVARLGLSGFTNDATHLGDRSAAWTISMSFLSIWLANS